MAVLTTVKAVAWRSSQFHWFFALMRSQVALTGQQEMARICLVDLPYLEIGATL